MSPPKHTRNASLSNLLSLFDDTVTEGGWYEAVSELYLPENETTYQYTDALNSNTHVAQLKFKANIYQKMIDTIVVHCCLTSDKASPVGVNPHTDKFGLR